MPLNVPEHTKLRIEDFLVLEATGAFAEVHKTELIDGGIIGVNSQYRPHSHAKNEFGYRLKAALAAGMTGLGVLVEATVAMPPHDLPEPDIVVTSEPCGEGFVPLASVALLVEVADTTLAFDMRQKATLYASQGVPEYWVVDLNAARIVRMWAPGPAGYAEAGQVPFGSPITAATIAGLTVATEGLR